MAGAPAKRFVTGSVTRLWQSDRTVKRQGTDVRFVVIENSREWTEPARRVAETDTAAILAEDVEAEAQRRLRACHLQEWRNREFITGRPMPHEVRHFALQVAFAAEAISRLSPIPDDFDSDIYWPKYWA